MFWEKDVAEHPRLIGYSAASQMCFADCMFDITQGFALQLGSFSQCCFCFTYLEN